MSEYPFYPPEQFKEQLKFSWDRGHAVRSLIAQFQDNMISRASTDRDTLEIFTREEEGPVSFVDGNSLREAIQYFATIGCTVERVVDDMGRHKALINFSELMLRNSSYGCTHCMPPPLSFL